MVPAYMVKSCYDNFVKCCRHYLRGVDMAKIIMHLRQFRRARNLTTRSLENISEISHTQISRIERGSESPTLKTLLKLSTALGVGLKDMFDVLEEES